MKVIQINSGQYSSFVRHWGKWYLLLEDGGLIALDPKWFEEARRKQSEKA